MKTLTKTVMHLQEGRMVVYFGFSDVEPCYSQVYKSNIFKKLKIQYKIDNKILPKI